MPPASARGVPGWHEAAAARSRLARMRALAVIPPKMPAAVLGSERLHSAHGSRSGQLWHMKIAAWRSPWSPDVHQSGFTPGELHRPALKSGWRGRTGVWGRTTGPPERLA